MRLLIAGAVATLMAATSSNALAERQLLRYGKPDAGTLVLSFSNTDAREVGCLVERFDENGSAEITSQPRRSQHDFTEQFDSAGYVKALNITGYDSDETEYNGKVELVKLPPGKYHFLTCSANYGVNYTPFPTSTKLPEIAFEIETGKATYVGAFRLVPLKAKSMFGTKVVKGYSVQRLNMAERDLGIAKSVGVNVSDAIIAP